VRGDSLRRIFVLIMSPFRMRQGDKLKTLLVHSRGMPTVRRCIEQTLLRGIFNVPAGYKITETNKRKSKLLSIVGNMLEDPYEGLGYVNDWLEAFIEHPNIEANLCDMSNLIECKRMRRKLKDFQLIVILHSAFGDTVSPLSRMSHWLNERRGKLVVFPGNEYDLMSEKTSFIREVGADYVCTQLPPESGAFVYESSTEAKVLSLPAALNAKVYHSSGVGNRRFGIGFKGAQYPKWLGDSERNDFVYLLQKKMSNSGHSISIGTGNVDRCKWADFLRSCCMVAGAEAGTYFLDPSGRIMEEAKLIAQQNPECNHEQIIKAAISKTNCSYVSGKVISSRHFEAIGTQTGQILIEGNYNGILMPDIHYVAVKKDMSNLGEKLRELEDKDRMASLIQSAWDLVSSRHTYRHRIDELITAVV